MAAESSRTSAGLESVEHRPLSPLSVVCLARRLPMLSPGRIGLADLGRSPNQFQPPSAMTRWQMKLGPPQCLPQCLSAAVRRMGCSGPTSLPSDEKSIRFPVTLATRQPAGLTLHCIDRYIRLLLSSEGLPSLSAPLMATATSGAFFTGKPLFQPRNLGLATPLCLLHHLWRPFR